MRLFIYIFLFFFWLGGCTSQPKFPQNKISVGMDKSAVLEALGNPSRSKRVKGADRWSYDTHLNNVKTTHHIYFQDGKVSYIDDSDQDQFAPLSDADWQKTNETPKDDAEFREL